jgi:hypothetical protein
MDPLVSGAIAAVWRRRERNPRLAAHLVCYPFPGSPGYTAVPFGTFPNDVPSQDPDGPPLPAIVSSKNRENSSMTAPFIDHPDTVRFPVGGFGVDPDVTPEKRRRWVRETAEMPQGLAEAVHGLQAQQLGTPCREGGWTPRQVVHHLADAHINGFVRLRHHTAQISGLRSRRGW